MEGSKEVEKESEGGREEREKIREVSVVRREEGVKDRKKGEEGSEVDKVSREARRKKFGGK